MKHQRGVHIRRILSVLAPVAVGLILMAPTAKLGAQIPFSASRIIFEINSTAGDGGVQVFLDGEGWEKLTIVGPDGQRRLRIAADGSLGVLGLTELFFESEEPPFEELPLEDLLLLFPAGEYQFLGMTVEGERMVSTATLTHNLPDGPVIVSPRPGRPENPNFTVIEWEPVTSPAGIEIAGYEVIVAGPEPANLHFDIHLPAKATSVTVPREFLDWGTEYKFEILAIEVGGNQTITESEFRTR